MINHQRTLLNLSETEREYLTLITKSYEEPRKCRVNLPLKPRIVCALKNLKLVTILHYKRQDVLCPTPLGSTVAKLLADHYIPPRSSRSRRVE
jgi:hypothetical protein